jgi:hypothetical protein
VKHPDVHNSGSGDAPQRCGVLVSDLVYALGELSAVAGALVAVRVDGAVQPLAAVASATEL